MARRRRRETMFGRRHPDEDEGPIQANEPGIRETLGPEMTVVGRGARLEGALESVESIRIDGRVKGRIAARGDVILTADSHVEANIHAQNVVTGGTLKGNVTARAMAELAEGGRMEGSIRSKVLVVREGALFSGEASVDLGDALGEADEAAYPEDELRTDYEHAVRRAAEWYRSSLAGANGDSAHEGREKPVAADFSEPDESMPEADERSLTRLA